MLSATARHDCDHQAPYWAADARCTRCGHRTFTRWDGIPAPTRELPAILWPFELAARIEARLRGWLGVH